MASVAGEMFRRVDLLSYACGALIVICFLVMKFVGPPPQAFFPRLAVILLMLAVAGYARVRHLSATAASVNVALGAILLFWYTRE